MSFRQETTYRDFDIMTHLPIPVWVIMGDKNTPTKYTLERDANFDLTQHLFPGHMTSIPGMMHTVEIMTVTPNEATVRWAGCRMDDGLYFVTIENLHSPFIITPGPGLSTSQLSDSRALILDSESDTNSYDSESPKSPKSPKSPRTDTAYIADRINPEGHLYMQSAATDGGAALTLSVRYGASWQTHHPETWQYNITHVIKLDDEHNGTITSVGFGHSYVNTNVDIGFVIHKERCENMLLCVNGIFIPTHLQCMDGKHTLHIACSCHDVRFYYDDGLIYTHRDESDEYFWKKGGSIVPCVTVRSTTAAPAGVVMLLTTESFG